MALTEFQRSVCRLIAGHRIQSGESYIAGGVALNTVIHSNRLSRDIDLFHDTMQAVAESWEADRALLSARGYDVRIEREREGYVEALVSQGSDSVVMQWTTDSAFRFMPLVQHEDFGLVLHPIDLATNKVLALVGRLEARDWVDLIFCHARVQPLGCLAWAASGKDPAFSPAAILEQAARSAHYSADEIEELAFAGPSPDPAELARRWHQMLREANDIVFALPPEHAGTCVLNHDGALFVGDCAVLRSALSAGAIQFHQGRIRGALPQVRN